MRKCKLLYAFILVFCLTLPLSLSVSAADDNTVALSEDYTELEYRGEVYRLFNYYESEVYLAGLEYFDADVTLSDKQIEAIDYYEVFSSDIAINLDITFVDGGYRSLYYLRVGSEGRIADFLAEGSGLYTTFGSFGGIVEMSAAELLSERVTLPASEYIRYSAVPVTEVSADGLLERDAGEYIITSDGDAYFLDYSLIGTDSEDFLPPLHGNLTVWRITDTELLEKLKSDDPIAPQLGEGILVMLLLAVLAFIFGAIPLASLITSLILLPRFGKKYRRLLILIASLAAATLVLFIVTVSAYAVVL